MSAGFNILISRVKNEDEKAFCELYDKYKSKLYYFALKFTKSSHYAEEIVQEVFIKIWEVRKDLNPNLSFKSYIFTITYNSIINFLKKAANDEKVKKEVYLLSGFQDAMFNGETGVEYEKILHNAINKLPPKRREIFTLAKIEGKSYLEIAEKLNIAKDTVRLQVIEAKKFIKDFVKTNIHHLPVITFLVEILFRS